MIARADSLDNDEPLKQPSGLALGAVQEAAGYLNRSPLSRGM